jgi:hypothetical protein
VHRCGSLGIRLAHQTSLPNVNAPQIAERVFHSVVPRGTHFPLGPPHALLTAVPDVRGDRHRGGSRSDCRNSHRAPLGEALNHFQRGSEWGFPPSIGYIPTRT